MYIQLEDFNSYMSPENKDWLHIFVESPISKPAQNLHEGASERIPKWLGSCGPFQLLCDPSFSCDQTEKPLSFVFTRSEKFVLNDKEKGLFLLLQMETYYSTFA